MNNKKNIKIAINILLIISVISGVLLIIYMYSLNRDVKEFNNIANIFYDNQLKENKGNEQTETEGIDSYKEDASIIAGLETLYDKNNDIIGWINIEGTNINYPVMYTPNEPEYYLKRNFDKEYSISGVLFVDGKCSINPRSDNLLIHGHNMKNGSMFADLLLFEKEDLLKKYSTIEFYSFNGKEIYDIISVFPTEVYNDENIEFVYHDFIDGKNEEEFNNYIENIKKASLFETGVTAEYKDKLLTLSTCAYHSKNGRFVVIGKGRIEDK